MYFYTLLRGIGRSAFMILFPLHLLSIGYSTESLGGVVTSSALIMVTILPIVGFATDKGLEQRGTRLLRVILITISDFALDQLVIFVPSSQLHSIRAQSFPLVSCTQQDHRRHNIRTYHGKNLQYFHFCLQCFENDYVICNRKDHLYRLFRINALYRIDHVNWFHGYLSSNLCIPQGKRKDQDQ